MKLIVVSIVFACVAVLMAFVFINYPFSPKAEGLRSSLSELGESVTQPQDKADLVRSMAVFRALPRPASCRDKRVLILYDTSGPWGYLGEIDALFTANLAGRWASYDAMPVSNYRSGEIADRNWVLRDGFASFYFHWYLNLDRLKEIVEPLQARGWKFVSVDSVVAETACSTKER